MLLSSLGHGTIGGDGGRGRRGGGGHLFWAIFFTKVRWKWSSKAATDVRTCLVPITNAHLW